jgi:activator of 2-hydroxyglutaryl-CoA dehydratase
MGIDVGSTTAKIAILDHNQELIFSKYERHYSDLKSTVTGLVEQAYAKFRDTAVTVMVTGSGGISVAEACELDFIQ